MKRWRFSTQAPANPADSQRELGGPIRRTSTQDNMSRWSIGNGGVSGKPFCCDHDLLVLAAQLLD